MRCYTQFTQEQRYQMYALMKAGLKQTEIANIIGVNILTISRELSCNMGLLGYRPSRPISSFWNGRPQKAHPRILASTWHRVETLLRQLP